MNRLERKALVDAMIAERKDAVSSWRVRDPYRATNSRQRAEIERTRSRFNRPRAGESGDAYISRTAEGGDSSFGDAAARYDLRRPRGAKPAPHFNEDYGVSYNGWANRARMRNNRRR